MKKMKNIISPKELVELLSASDLFIADCRFTLDDPGLGRTQYEAGHVPGAVYVSLDGDLSAPVSVHGGRHPLPAVESAVFLLSSLGIERGKTRVIVYDEGGSAWASRFWWMLRYLGHDDVRIMDGGFTDYIAAGGPVSAELPLRQWKEFIPAIRTEMLVSMPQIMEIAGQGRLIDARAPERFAGENETIDIVAGHIPLALNHHWMKNLDENGRLLSIERLFGMFGSFPEQPVMYCGSGVTACMNVLAMEEAGFPLPGLYVGSWSDWISFPENSVATGRR